MLIHCPVCGNKISKKADHCLRCGHPMEEPCYIVRKYHVVNYDSNADYKACEVEFQGSNVSMIFTDYESEHPSAILVELKFVDEFNRLQWRREVAFNSIIEGDDLDIFETEPIPVDIYDIDWSIIWGVYVEIKGLRDEYGLHEPETGNYQIIDRKNLRKLREARKKYGADAVDIPEIADDNWKCRCGNINQKDENFCLCGFRKAKIENTKLDFSNAEVEWKKIDTYIENKLLEMKSVYDMRLFILGLIEDWPELAGLSEFVMKYQFYGGDKEEKMEKIRDEIAAYLEDIDWNAFKQE